MNYRLSKSLLFVGFALPVLALAGFRYAGTSSESGPKVGGDVYAFQPTHVTGPDKGTNTCPVCKYGKEPAAQVWVNNDDPGNVVKIAKTLESAIDKDGLHKFRAFVVYIPGKGQTDAAMTAKLSSLAAKNGIDKVAFTFVNGESRDAISQYQINTDPSVKNTVFVYRDRTVQANFVNLKADDAGLAKLQASIAKAVRN